MSQLAKRIMTMTDEECKELEQVDKQEVKEEKKEQGKRDLKLVITSIVATLLFIIILLLLVLLSLKKCSNGSNVNSSSSSEISTSEPKYHYDDTKLNDVFKRIVINQVSVDIAPIEDIDNIIAISYEDIVGSKFTLNIDFKIGDNIYYYRASNVLYANHETFVSYLLTLNPNKVEPVIPLINGDELEISSLPSSLVKLTNEKINSHYVIANGASNSYLSGFYYEDSVYHTYTKKELTNTESFPLPASGLIDLNSPLYGYYQDILNK